MGFYLGSSGCSSRSVFQRRKIAIHRDHPPTTQSAVRYFSYRWSQRDKQKCTCNLIRALRSVVRTQPTLSYKSCGIFQESSLSTGPSCAWRAIPSSKSASGSVPSQCSLEQQSSAHPNERRLFASSYQGRKINS